jgi:hypothetical protein
MLVCPRFPNAYAMQCMPKSDINFNSKSREQDPKRNKFRIVELIGSLIGMNFLDEFEIHHRTFDLIETSIIMP